MVGLSLVRICFPSIRLSQFLFPPSQCTHNLLGSESLCEEVEGVLLFHPCVNVRQHVFGKETLLLNLVQIHLHLLIQDFPLIPEVIKNVLFFVVQKLMQL